MATPRQRVNAQRDRSGNLLPSAWPGMYPVYYWTSEDTSETLCASCANEAEQEGDEIAGVAVHWEGPPLFCSCGKEIESAYGDPWADEDA